MIKNQGPLLLLAVIMLACGTTGRRGTSTDPFAAQMDSLMTQHSRFSGVVLLATQGTPRYFKAFGFRNYDQQIPMDTSDLFELASVSKQFTAMTTMMLHEKHHLGYDEPMANYLPELPYPGITIRQLLNHTSGLPDYQAVMDEHWDKSKVAGNNDIIEYLIQYHPPSLFSPGEAYKYSNTGYVMLGSITEKISGEDFVRFCQQRIFDPLKMSSTAIRSNQEKEQLSNLAYGYIYVPEKNRYVRADSFPSSNYTIWLGARKGPGRVSSTARDLLRWDQALYGDALVSQTTLQDAFMPAVLKNDSLSYYGFGWNIEDGSPLGKVVWHDGDNPGYKTLIVRYLDHQATLILLSNNAYDQLEGIRHAVDSMLLSQPD